MSSILTLISDTPYIDLPPDWIGWLGFLALLGLILVLQWKWRGFNRPFGRAQWGILAVLLVLTPITSLFIGLELNALGPAGQSALPLQGVPLEPTSPTVMIFAALPWMLAAGL